MASGSGGFVPLHVHSPFSFLDGASPLERLVERAAELGFTSLALTDHDNVCAAPRLFRLAQAAGLKPIQGAEVTVGSVLGSAGPARPGGEVARGPAVARGGGPAAETAYHLTLLAQGPEGYANLCRLLTRAHLENPRRRPRASPDALEALSSGLIALSGCRRGEIPSLVLQGRFAEAEQAARWFLERFGRDRFYLEVVDDRLPGSRGLARRLGELGERLGVGLAATTNVHYADKAGFPVHDLLTCVRTLTRLGDVHPERRLNAENYMKPPAEMAWLADAGLGQALLNPARIAEACRPALALGQRVLPAFAPPPGETAEGFLRRLVWQGAERRYGRITAKVRDRVEHELDVISRLGYVDYFLLVWDIVRHARERGVRCAGRGSAADSVVSYCLGLTEVDALARGLLFERFLSLERAQQPDIDLDFDARRRDEVAEYVYRKYGRDRVAAVCTYNTFLARSAVRDLGKAMDLPAAEIDALARRCPWMPADRLRQALDRYPELRALGLPREKFERLLDMCGRVAGFPRHLGTHLGGLVITGRPVVDLVPLQMAAKGLVVCQFDKDGVEDLGLIKLDLLSLRVLTAVEDALAMAKEAGRPLDFDAIPTDDRESLAMINRGETIGVFQLESPAQRALQARLRARGFEDIVASVALIRPGPIKGNMVEPFLARRRGREPVTYLHPALEPILRKTYGVVLFQEQVIEIATAVAGFSPGEADALRRAMTHRRSQREMDEIGRKFVLRAVDRGVDEAAARAIFSCMAGYASYGFCEAHAAAFASTACKTAYLARHCPAEFFAAILSSQPMGFYPPSVLTVELRRRGVAVLGPDINRSGADYRVEGLGAGRAPAAGRAVRVSLRQVKGMGEASLEAILRARAAGPFRSLEDFCARVDVDRDLAENLVLCGAFDAVEAGALAAGTAVSAVNRRALLWRVAGALERGRRLRAAGGAGECWLPGPAEEAGVGASVAPSSPAVFEAGPEAGGPPGAPALADFSWAERLAFEQEILGFTVSGHFMEALRPALRRAGFRSSRELARLAHGARVRVAGLPVRPHRPPTRSGRTVVFLSLEDEGGLVDVTVFEDVYQRCGAAIFADPAPALAVEGRLQRRGAGVSVLAEVVEELGRRHLGGPAHRPDTAGAVRPGATGAVAPLSPDAWPAPAAPRGHGQALTAALQR
ncbi:MAG: DNA polymerase III subunit alpha [Acetobacteraceae bacterium]|nr:DNA polymerase III subunit alpha [Acetobacteraceae bacterium]